jgi:signal transduction histidine kinase
MEQIDLGKLLRQTLADMEEVINGSSVSLKTDIPESPVMIYADGQRLYRVFQNLIQNALQYSLESSRVYLTLACDNSNKTALTVVKNISRSELRNDIDFTARFTRGDASRTDGGSGLGLSIAQSFTEACGGSFRVETDADLFTVTVEFPVAEEPCS